MDNKNENRYVIIIAVMTQFIAAFVGNMLTIALKDIQHDLCMSIPNSTCFQLSTT